MTANKIKTSTIGAYPKPAYTPVKDWFPDASDAEAKKKGKGLLQRWKITDYDENLNKAGAEAEARFLQATREIIDDQVKAGIDIPTDGEVRRENYIFYQLRRIEGVDFQTVTRKSVRSGAFEADLPTITGAVSLRKTLLDRDYKAAQQFTDRPVKITIPGPMTITDSIADGFYNDNVKLGMDLGNALNKEILALADAGCRYIQVDEPVFARKPGEALSNGIENLERCFHGVPDDVVRMAHICCGYPSALDAEDYLKAELGAYLQIADAMDASSIHAVSIEDAHRNNDLELLNHYKNTTILLGVVDVAQSRVEPVDEIRERLKAACEHIDADRLIAAPDCGLGLLGRDLAVKKMQNLAAAAHSL